MERIIHAGTAASKGIAVGTAFVYVPCAGAEHPFTGIAAEKKRLAAAILTAKEEIAALVDKTKAAVGAAGSAILETQLALLEDPALIDRAADFIDSQSLSAERAVAAAAEEAGTLFDSMEDDPYLRERAADIRDVGRRLGTVLSGGVAFNPGNLPPGTILVARDLKPSETVQIDQGRVSAFLTDQGGPSSHSAIIARAMGIPCIVGMGSATSSVRNGDTVIVDASRGIVIVDPAPQTVQTYEAALTALEEERTRFKRLVGTPTVCKSGKRILLAANIGSPSEIDAALENGAEAIGLFRTEFLFMDRSALPTEEEQYAAYSSAAKRMSGRPVIVRTLDIGGDKTLPYLPQSQEDNPFLGVRAIRLCFRELDLFKAQLRALLRASVHGDLKIMFPMIASVSELEKAKALVSECKASLAAAGIPFRADVEVGIMVEIPSSALIAEELAARCDFFSIGTNDLTQYTLAVDRMNADVASLYDPMHPAVLRLIQMTIDAAHDKGIPCGMCGELAGLAEAVPTLLRYGLDEFSVGTARLGEIKNLILSC